MTDGYLPGQEPRPGQFAINRMTGDWITKAPLRHSESCVIAASVMPGWTPELVDALYGAWLDADGQDVAVVFTGGQVVIVRGTVGDMTQTPEQPTTPVEVPAKETVDVPVDPAPGTAPEVETTD